MTRHPSPLDTLGTYASRPPDEQTLLALLGLIANSVQADAIQIGIDQGAGYRRDCFIAPDCPHCLLSEEATPPFVVMREARVRRQSNPSGLVADSAWLDQRPLPVGTAGRRSAPRSGIALMRGPERSAFLPSERRMLTRLMPHLSYAISLAHELECTRQRETQTLALLEHAESACLLLNRKGEVLHGNRLAFELLAQADIRLKPRLTLPSPASQARFEGALARAAQGDSPLLVLPGPPVYLLRLHPAATAPGSQPTEFVLVLRGPRNKIALPHHLASHFGLTPAEFRLCAALADGLTLKECAQSWNRSYDTLRTQLKTILAKTGTHRQTELIALLGAFRADY